MNYLKIGIELRAMMGFLMLILVGFIPHLTL